MGVRLDAATSLNPVPDSDPVGPEAVEDLVSELARARRVLLDVVYAWTPENWYHSVESLQVLDKVKAVLPPRERLKLTKWLTQRGPA